MRVLAALAKLFHKATGVGVEAMRGEGKSGTRAEARCVKWYVNDNRVPVIVLLQRRGMVSKIATWRPRITKNAVFSIKMVLIFDYESVRCQTADGCRC
jgi:hypothetical protein